MQYQADEKENSGELCTTLSLFLFWFSKNDCVPPAALQVHNAMRLGLKGRHTERREQGDLLPSQTQLGMLVAATAQRLTRVGEHNRMASATAHLQGAQTGM